MSGRAACCSTSRRVWSAPGTATKGNGNEGSHQLQRWSALRGAIPVVLIALVVLGSVALAQEQGQQGPTKQPMGNGMSSDQMQMMHQQMVPGSQTSGTATPTMTGQDAFGAIQEIVRILEVDPKTDWSKVNLEALRQHLST